MARLCWCLEQGREGTGHPAVEELNPKRASGSRGGTSRVEGAMSMLDYPVKLKRMGWILSATAGLSLAVCVGASARARQEQEQGQQEQQGDRQQRQQEQQDGQQDQSPEPKGRPAYTPQDADKPPYSRDREMRNAPSRKDQPAQERQRAEAGQAVPETLMVPAGTIVLVRINDFLSSDRNRVGDQFTAELEQPLVVNGWVVARRGQMVTGMVKAAQKAGRVTGVSQLGVELTDLTVVDGRQLPVLTELWKGSGGTSHGQDAGAIATTTGLGAAIGAAADWGRGAAIGAGAGAAAGIAAVLLTRGRPTILEPETQLSFRLVDPVRVETGQAQQAFLPVTQEDYQGGRFERRGPRRVAGGYPAYPCGYYSPCYAYPGYFYPGYVGFYGGYYGGYYRR